MTSFGDTSEIEAELTARNRQIAKIRDELTRRQADVEEWQLRNAELLETNSALDSEATQKRALAAELEDKNKQLEETIEIMAQDMETIRTTHAEEIEEVKKEVAGKDDAHQAERDARDAALEQVKKVGEEMRSLAEELEQEKASHAITKTKLEASEGSVREAANQSAELRQRLKELEAEHLEKVEGLSASEAQRAANDQARTSAELAALRAEIGDHESARQALEAGKHEHGAHLESLRAEVEDSRARIAEHADVVSALEAARDEEKRRVEDQLKSQQSRHQDSLDKANSQAAALDGRLGGQRMLMEVTAEALEDAKKTEARMSVEHAMQAKEIARHTSELDAHRQAFELSKEQALSASAARESQLRAELESEQAVARQHARAELDSTSRINADAEERHRSLETTVTEMRIEHQTQNSELRGERRKIEQKLLETMAQSDQWREKAEEAERELRGLREQAEAQRALAEASDRQLRESEESLRRLAEGRMRELEEELEESRSTLSRQQAASAAQEKEFEEQLERFVTESQQASRQTAAVKEAASGDLRRLEEAKRELFERLGMQDAELSTRRVFSALERQRLQGALEESRRTLRSQFAVPNPAAAVDTGKIAALEGQLDLERRTSTERAKALESSERRVVELEDKAAARAFERSTNSALMSKEAELRSAQLSEDLQRLQASKATSEERLQEARETGMMTAAEMHCVRYEKMYENAKLRGSLEELRYMIKMAR